jgi:MFS family permease
VGPLSEVYGRSPIYRTSFFLFFVFTFPVTFAPNFGMHMDQDAQMLRLIPILAVYLIFRFITGFCGSAFLSVAGGTASDLFDNQHVATYVCLEFFQC